MHVKFGIKFKGMTSDGCDMGFEYIFIQRKDAFNTCD